MFYVPEVIEFTLSPVTCRRKGTRDGRRCGAGLAGGYLGWSVVPSVLVPRVESSIKELFYRSHMSPNSGAADDRAPPVLHAAMMEVQERAV